MQIKYILIYIIFVNILGYIIMYADKKNAKKGKYRIPEKNIFYISFLGGELGIIIAMKKLKHKISKKSFKNKLIMSIILQITLITCIIILGKE